MGLSFHYSGSFKNGASLQEMVDEVEDIARIYKWKYHVYETELPEAGFTKARHNGKIYGISFSPPECEPVWLCFLSNGKLSSPVHLQFYGTATTKTEKEYLHMLSVKTQYAGMQTHMLVIGVLKHISKKYFGQFELQDEGLYWETGDEKLLKETFERYGNLIDSVVNAFETFPLLEGETIEEYLERVIKFKERK